jgi:hypothetical protein
MAAVKESSGLAKERGRERVSHKSLQKSRKSLQKRAQKRVEAQKSRIESSGKRSKEQ